MERSPNNGVILNDGVAELMELSTDGRAVPMMGCLHDEAFPDDGPVPDDGTVLDDGAVLDDGTVPNEGAVSMLGLSLMLELSP